MNMKIKIFIISIILGTFALLANGESVKFKDKEKVLSAFSSVIYFDSDKSDIKPEYETTVVKLLSVLKAYPDNKVMICGHTDSSGHEQKNRELSNLRAETIANYFVQKGINQDRIETYGLSSTDPVGDNKTEDGRALNRRAEIVILSSDK